MGTWNYYIEIKADKQTLDRMIFEYKQNEMYQEVFFFGKLEDSRDEGYNAEIVSIIDNFLPANHLIYEFLSVYSSCNLVLKTNGIERMYNFIQKSDFIKYMYDAWESKIDFVYNRWGTIIINYKNYYRIRNKLYKKYWVRFPKKMPRI